MDIIEAIRRRHSVRAYQDKAIEATAVEALTLSIARCNEEADLKIQLVTNEKEAFSGFAAHYGKFSGVGNYIAFIAQKSPMRTKKSDITVKSLR